MSGQSTSSTQFIKTINLANVPNVKKEKLYSFINENKIQFNRDENGEIFAMVKFEHPDSIKQKQQKEIQSPIIKPEPESTKNIKNNQTMTTIDILIKNYPTFFGLVKPLVGIRAKKITIFDLKYYIEEIYSVAFLKYCMILKNKAHSKKDKTLLSFPHFVYEFLSNKYSKKTLIDQFAMNILLTCEYFKNENEEIRMFSLFLSELYTFDDIMFFLFLRSNIEKELKILFLEKAKDETKIQHMEDRDEILRDIHLNQKVIQKIIASVYNNDDEILFNQIMEKLEPLFEKDAHSSKYNTITSTQFLVSLVDEFHESRNTYEECKGVNTIPFLMKKQNEFFDLSEQNTNEQDMYLNMLYYFNNSCDVSFEDNIKNVLMTYIKEKEILIFFEKYFENEFNSNNPNNDEELIFEIRDIVLRKLYYLINIIFYDDYRAWNVSLSISQNNDNPLDLNEDFKKLVSLKQKLISSKTVTDLPQEFVEKFTVCLLSTPQILSQISKIIATKKNK